MTPTRRDLLAAAAGLGVGTPTFHRAVAAAVADFPATVTAEMVQNAEWVAGIDLTDDQRRQVANGLTQVMRGSAALHRAAVGNDVPPAVHFAADPTRPAAGPRGAAAFAPAAADRPAAADDLAFLPVAKLAALLRDKKLSSVELTRLYLDRLKTYDPALKCVVSLTEELALKQAADADQELAAGTHRGPLHGVPWVAKDLIAYPGYKTTWGAGPFKDQTLPGKATVADRIDRAGGVLVAKVSLGALAQGDQWFGGMTRNPWNVRQGSSGSSAGSAAAVAAGLAGYGIGSETWGSIISPCTRCGVTGLRPTFGRVSRHGCMALSWSMDKLGPIARSVEDCALILSVIHGHDGHDPTAVTHPFAWPAPRPVKELRVGVFEDGTPDEVKKVLADLGVRLVPFRLPAGLPVDALRVILDVESSAAFDDLTRAGNLQGTGAWPATFRRGRFVPAVEYLRAQRVRTLLMRKMAEAMTDVDLYAGSPDNGLLTNLTGHPAVCVPNGLRRAGGVDSPTSLTFTGRLWGEAEMLAVAQAYQEATGHHLRRPDMTKVTPENAEPKK